MSREEGGEEGEEREGERGVEEGNFLSDVREIYGMMCKKVKGEEVIERVKDNITRENHVCYFFLFVIVVVFCCCILLLLLLVAV